ncbi:hypothetical protein [Acinetobacter bereziniae]|uniref:hypothetical protein n=1 Tax=Acinetobacter bereziniae TaxID=106648 RepID=UPI00300A948C
MANENTILVQNDEVYLDKLIIQSIDDEGNATCTWIDQNGKEYNAVFILESLTKQPENQFAGFLG